MPAPGHSPVPAAAVGLPTTPGLGQLTGTFLKARVPGRLPRLPVQENVQEPAWERAAFLKPAAVLSFTLTMRT